MGSGMDNYWIIWNNREWNSFNKWYTVIYNSFLNLKMSFTWGDNDGESTSDVKPFCLAQKHPDKTG